MIDEKWKQLVDAARKNFKNAELSHEDLIVQTADGPQKRGTQDILIFDHPAGGRYKLVRENHPVVLEKKEFFSHRAGDTARTEYKFSDTEFSHKLRIYKETDYDEWDEVTLEKLGL